MTGLGPASRRRRIPTFDSQTLAELPVLLLLVTALGWLAAKNGGFETTTWAPAAAVTIGVAATLAVAAPRLLSFSPLVLVAAAALGGYAVWSYLSLLWADDRGTAWNAANLTLFYVVLFTLLATRPVAERTLLLALTVLAVTLAVVALVVVWQASRTQQSAAVALLDGRLSSPTGYPNATAALFFMGFWLGFGLALHPALWRWARSVSLAAGGISLAACLLAESRGWVLTAPIVLVVFLALYPRRLQALICLAATGAVLGASLHVLLGPFRVSADDKSHALAQALVAMLVLGSLLAVVGAAIPWADGLRVPRRVARATLGLLALAVVTGIVVVVATAHPVDRLRADWVEFKTSKNSTGRASHFTGLGSNRYDFWRVGLIEFRRHPLTGIGADNFAIPYVADRHSSEQPLYPHALWVRALAETGIVGSILLVTGIGAALLLVVRSRSRPEGLLAVPLATVFLGWFLHAQGDWLWEMPVLGATAFAILGVAARVAAPAGRERRLPATRTAAAATVAVTAVALAAVCLPWIGVRYQNQAVGIWREDPSGALALLDRAAAANPLSDAPLVLAGAIASRVGDYPAMRSKFTEAVGRNPRSWYSHLELGLALAYTGRLAQAQREVAVAQQLNPRDGVLRGVARTIRAGHRPDLAAIDAAYALQTEQITGA